MSKKMTTEDIVRAVGECWVLDILMSSGRVMGTLLSKTEPRFTPDRGLAWEPVDHPAVARLVHLVPGEVVAFTARHVGYEEGPVVQALKGGPLTRSELAQKLKIPQADCKGMIETAMAKGFVRESRDENGGRFLRVVEEPCAR